MIWCIFQVCSTYELDEKVWAKSYTKTHSVFVIWCLYLRSTDMGIIYGKFHERWVILMQSFFMYDNYILHVSCWQRRRDGSHPISFRIQLISINWKYRKLHFQRVSHGKSRIAALKIQSTWWEVWLSPVLSRTIQLKPETHRRIRAWVTSTPSIPQSIKSGQKGTVVVQDCITSLTVHVSRRQTLYFCFTNWPVTWWQEHFK